MRPAGRCRHGLRRRLFPGHRRRQARHSTARHQSVGTSPSPFDSSLHLRPAQSLPPTRRVRQRKPKTDWRANEAPQSKVNYADAARPMRSPQFHYRPTSQFVRNEHRGDRSQAQLRFQMCHCPSGRLDDPAKTEATLRFTGLKAISLGSDCAGTVRASFDDRALSSLVMASDRRATVREGNLPWVVFLTPGRSPGGHSRSKLRAAMNRTAPQG
jgi:hypothetical protein